MNETYHRVLPRDLFNESKLLKCIGKLILLIEEGQLYWLEYQYIHDGEPFQIKQDPNFGCIYVANINFYDKQTDQHIDFSIPCNDRSNWPLWVDGPEETSMVFTDEGQLLLTRESALACYPPQSV